MATRCEVVKNLASQRIWFRAPEGRPASAAVGIKDDGATVVNAAATTTVDPVNTTVSSAGAAAGVRTIPLTAVTGIRLGATYRLDNLTAHEEVRVIGIGASSVTIDDALRFAYVSTNPFQSTEFYATLAAGDVDTLGELFVATATYTVTGYVVQPLVQTFDVVLHPLAGRSPLTVELLKSRWPDLMGQEYDQQKGEGYERQRLEAWNNVIDGIYEQGRRPALIVDAESLKLWALAEFALLLHESGVEVIRGLTALDALNRLDTKLTTAKRDALANLRWYDKVEDEALDEETESRPLAQHFVA